ncbi:DUF1963 domain-containing protein [Lysinibacillus sp. FSL K6-0232]|uniref:DUF1963 domain-containing protein n=1 Tax=unclassified Lysinibacillus TaxID=2636778 RepID=UPI0030FA5CCB
MHKTEELLALAKSSIRMLAQPFSIGRSKMGGCSDVPAHFTWLYTNDDSSLYFLCQVNLTEIKPYDKHHA